MPENKHFWAGLEDSREWLFLPEEVLVLHFLEGFPNIQHLPAALMICTAALMICTGLRILYIPPLPQDLTQLLQFTQGVKELKRKPS